MQELTETAAYHKLRRLCLKGKNGKLKVPESVHEDYVKGGPARDALMDELQRSKFLTSIKKSSEKLKEKENKVRKRWLTLKQMKDEEKWSALDKYDQRIEKFHVDVEESGHVLDRQSEREEQEERSQA
eukprot:s617_g22.t1